MKKTEKKEKVKKPTGSDADVSVGLRFEASLFKMKKFVDNLVDEYSNTTSVQPHEAKDIVSQKAMNYMNKGAYDKAIDEFNRLINMGKEDASIYYNLGLCCEREELDQEAEKAYKKALEMDKKLDTVLYRLGMLAIKNDDPDSAIKSLSVLAEKDDVEFDVLYQLGVAYDKKKDLQNAKEIYKKAQALDPKSPKVYKRLGYVLDAQCNHEDAVECFKKAMELEEVY